MTRYIFKFSDFFPADDPLSEWAVTISLAYNDLSLLNEHLKGDVTTQHRWFYWLRLTISHFGEAASYLERTQDVPQVATFVARLPEHAQAHYTDCLERYARNEATIKRIRNDAGFHYPALRIVQSQRRRRAVQRALAELASGNAVADVGEEGVVRGSRMLFADEVAASLIARASGGLERFVQVVEPEIALAITSFMRFANPAIDEFLVLGHERGGDWRAETRDGDPNP